MKSMQGMASSQDVPAGQMVKSNNLRVVGLTPSSMWHETTPEEALRVASKDRPFMLHL